MAHDDCASCEQEQLAKRARPAGNLENYAEAVADFLIDFWQGKTSADQGLRLFDDQVIWHDSLLPEAPLFGQEQLKGLVDFFRGSMPDLSLNMQRPLHVGEQGVVLGYWKASGTHTGALGPSLPPSGARVSWEGSVVIRTQPALAAPSQPGGEEQAAEPTPGADGGAVATGLLGSTVWWSWDPVFLFRELGWKEQFRPAGGAVPAPPAEDDLATRTAMEARDAFATEAEAAEAAAAAVAAAAAATERLAESPEALAMAQAANRTVVEMYFHTYNTGGYMTTIPFPLLCHPVCQNADASFHFGLQIPYCTAVCTAMYYGSTVYWCTSTIFGLHPAPSSHARISV
ncbi:hypothetical protein Vretifemale_15196 [Volvox reticuliferus]|uniref:SnoaL-like domain-containing protein n=1 Tax=Volvox reticuliferus TaxID=1737510 RepID=A0A8J4FUY4_9CHLO|nr:hypothetical protein Vretifemale_15196 [Volvox reticuliferus]